MEYFRAQLIGTDAQSAIVPGAGHWLMEAAPGFVIPKLVDFLSRSENPPQARRRGQ